MRIVTIDRNNWESFLALKVKDSQRAYVPSSAESLAAAYIKPWDEALDVYGITLEGIPVGLFYISYTPESSDNYWLGGFFIDAAFQGKGLGRRALLLILKWFEEQFPKALELWLTVEGDNGRAKELYASCGFIPVGAVNKYGEEKYRLELK